jgi:hypothetical protein
VLGDGAPPAIGGRSSTRQARVERSDVHPDNLPDGGGTFEQRGTGITVIATAKYERLDLIIDGRCGSRRWGASAAAMSVSTWWRETLVIDAAMTGNAFANVFLPGVRRRGRSPVRLRRRHA